MIRIPGRSVLGLALAAAGLLMLLMLDRLSRTPRAGAQAASDVADWIDSAALLETGFGEVEFESWDGNQLKALVYRASGFDQRSGPIWFVMHGQSRAAERYIRTAAPIAERHDALAIVIHFTRDLYPRGSDYTLGLTRRGRTDGSAWGEGRWLQPEAYLYAEVERVFAAVRQALGGSQPGYYLFGHSAGAQFAHRLMTFLTDARVIRAVVANAGWYTLPVNDAQPSATIPYGLRGSPLEPRDLADLFATPLVVLLGERDTATPNNDDLVRGTTEAMAQGASRFERGHYYFETSRAQARSLGLEFAWRLAVVPRAEHDAAQVIASAAHFLFAPDAPPCEPSAAAAAEGIVITEILADPPRGEAGDANGDGRRDPLEDEFVEIVNTGQSSICLTGWTLGDARNAERHVFPVDHPLAPGEAVIVFGGGVPTGDFGGAHVQHAAFSGNLSLSNAGDVLTLRDADGAVVSQVSWGDCAGETCAEEHWPGDLAVAASIARSPEPHGEWSLHTEHSGARFSPGVRTDGSPW